MTTLTPFDDRDVVETTVRIVGAGDGLSEAVHEPDDCSQFEAELEQHQPPRNADIDAISNRLIL
jgi:hypothetical protein